MRNKSDWLPHGAAGAVCLSVDDVHPTVGDGAEWGLLDRLQAFLERHPRLRVVCVEADAGWVPHYMYRMDHAWKRHRYWLPAGMKLSKLPSEYFAENIYVTFQDDWVAFKVANLLNWRRLLWANDFPHSDSTWPWSQEMLAEHTQALSAEQKRAILCDNVAELYGIDLAALA